MLAWIDLEMTGLDPARHTIVEIASLVTDDDLTIIEEGPDLVVHASPDDLAQMDDVVRNMHTTSGLLAEMEASTLTLAQAGDQTLTFLKKHIRQPRTVPLAGNSIGTDRRFLAAHLPEIENWLHYRSVDVSTVKELCRRAGISTVTFYKWKNKYVDMEISEVRRMRLLEDENARLKKIVAQQALDIDALKLVLSKKW